MTLTGSGVAPVESGSGVAPAASGSGVAPLQPDPERFAAMAARFSTVPVWLELSADTLTPVSAFLRVVGVDGHGFLLESVEGGERWGRYSFVGRHPSATLVARASQIEVTGELPCGSEVSGGVLPTLRSILAASSAPELAELPPLHSGVVGFLGYDVVREVERLPEPPPDDQGLPDAVLSVIGQLVAFDHWRQRVVLVDNVVPGPSPTPEELAAAYAAAGRRLAELACALTEPVPGEAALVPPAAPGPLPELRRTVSSEAYQAAVRVAKEHIRAGDIFQVVLSQRFDVALEAAPFDCYRALRQLNPSPYLYFLSHPEVALVGSSPEPLVRFRERRVVSRPIAGTRRRGRTEVEDQALAAELVEHPKERAEHVMLVDLARNDIGRVIRFGTAQVDELMTLERYSHVMHLTSQVSGVAADGVGPVDVLAATLPAGTVSGAPKVRAMELIDELEPTRRGPYAGVVGYVDFSGNLDTAIAIRTMVVRPDGVASVQAGAGIVADSDPAGEDQECADKARALLSAIAPARLLTRVRTGGAERAER